MARSTGNLSQAPAGSTSMEGTTTKETLGFQAEVSQLLQLMIHSLYGN
jgi:hypothetical protein